MSPTQPTGPFKQSAAMDAAVPKGAAKPTNAALLAGGAAPSSASQTVTSQTAAKEKTAKAETKLTLGPFGLRDLVVFASVIVLFVGTLLPVQKLGGLTLWQSSFGLFYLAIGILLPLIVAVLWLLRRVGPKKNVRVGSLTTDQFAGVVACLALAYHFLNTVTAFSWAFLICLIGAAGLFAATVLHPWIPAFIKHVPEAQVGGNPTTQTTAEPASEASPSMSQSSKAQLGQSAAESAESDGEAESAKEADLRKASVAVAPIAAATAAGGAAVVAADAGQPVGANPADAASVSKDGSLAERETSDRPGLNEPGLNESGSKESASDAADSDAADSAQLGQDEQTHKDSVNDVPQSYAPSSYVHDSIVFDQDQVLAAGTVEANFEPVASQSAAPQGHIPQSVGEEASPNVDEKEVQKRNDSNSEDHGQPDPYAADAPTNMNPTVAMSRQGQFGTQAEPARQTTSPQSEPNPQLANEPADTNATTAIPRSAQTQTFAATVDPASHPQENTAGQLVYEAFWFAVDKPKAVVDEGTGQFLYNIEPGAWVLALQDRGQDFLVQNSDGRVGVLRDLRNIERAPEEG